MYECITFLISDGTLTADEPKFFKSVIHSCAKLDYGTAQKMIDGEIVKGRDSERESKREKEREGGRCHEMQDYWKTGSTKYLFSTPLSFHYLSLS